MRLPLIYYRISNLKMYPISMKMDRLKYWKMFLSKLKQERHLVF